MTDYSHFGNSRVCPANGYSIGAKGSEIDLDLDQFILQGEIADISTGASSWVVSPYACTIEKIYTVIDGAITVGDAAISFEIGGTAITGGGITIANAASAAGDVDSSTPTALNIVAVGGAIEIITDGGSTDAAKAEVIFVCKRT